jgi:tripartite-type tricarboxylate transporter receptor subunit TctC
VFAPAKTRDEVVDRIYAAIHKALQVPRLREYFLVAGYQPVGDPPARFRKNFQADLKRWAELVRLAKIVPE